ncbi:MAG: hypothetical protein J0H80_20930, partial [Rhizobiales bacterium]|nr:hypothetical protein [Hyphomicrobiales bacterium]
PQRKYLKSLTPAAPAAGVRLPTNCDNLSSVMLGPVPSICKVSIFSICWQILGTGPRMTTVGGARFVDKRMPAFFPRTRALPYRRNGTGLTSRAENGINIPQYGIRGLFILF